MTLRLLIIRMALVAAAVLAFAATAEAKKVPFRVTSDPPGATVLMNGRTLGQTPLQLEVEDWMVKGHGRWLFSKYLGEPVELSLSKEGYFPKSMSISRGPFEWTNLDRSAVHRFYVLTDTTFHIKLDKKVEFTSTNPFTASAPPAPTTVVASTGGLLTTEQLVTVAMPAVVTVRTELGSGTGFFITDSGVVVTNKHVIEGATSAKVVLADGRTFDSVSMFKSPDRDLALIKVDGDAFPFLKLADPSTIRTGADVVAIGSPGTPGSNSTLAGTVTRGIISAFRNTTDEGVLIQTDVSINPGNSGGPLLSLRGDVVGVTTMKITGQGVSGLNFALMSNEVLDLLERHFDYKPKYLNEPSQSDAVARTGIDNKELSSSLGPATPTSTGVPPGESRITIQVTSEPAGADIYVDDEFIGSTPSKVRLAPGTRTIRIARPGFMDWRRQVRVEPGTELTFNAVLEKATP